MIVHNNLVCIAKTKRRTKLQVSSYKVMSKKGRWSLPVWITVYCTHVLKGHIVAHKYVQLLLIKILKKYGKLWEHEDRNELL